MPKQIEKGDSIYRDINFVIPKNSHLITIFAGCGMYIESTENQRWHKCFCRKGILYKWVGCGMTIGHRNSILTAKLETAPDC